MILKEALLKSLEDLKKPSNHNQVCEHVIEKGYYEFGDAKTPWATVSASLGYFIRKGDVRVRRIKGQGGAFFYYLSKFENELGSDIISKTNERNGRSAFHERDLHLLLSTYLKSLDIYSKTIFHEQSKQYIDSNQKWIHPDMLGIDFLNLGSKVNRTFLKSIDKSSSFKILSYEIKKSINTDSELKRSFFQAVSNSSWANYGYLAAFEVSDNLNEEVARLSESFGIGIILLAANPYESKILYPSRYKELDVKTIDKLCQVNPDFEQFIEQTEKLLNASDKYVKSTRKELEEFCDDYLKSDSEIREYCLSKNIEIAETETQG